MNQKIKICLLILSLVSILVWHIIAQEAPGDLTSQNQNKIMIAPSVYDSHHGMMYSKGWNFHLTKHEQDSNGDGIEDIVSTFTQINDTMIEIYVNDTIEKGSYKWASAICNTSKVNSIQKLEYNPSTQVWSNTGNLNFGKLINYGLPSAWCNQTNGTGFVLFGAGSGDKTYRLILPSGQKEMKIYTGSGSEEAILVYQDLNLITYNFELGSTNFTLLKNNQLVSDVFVYWNEDKYKFGANDSSNLGLANYSYLINSTSELVFQEQSDENSTYFYPIIYNFIQTNFNEQRFVYNFIDVCSKNYSNCKYVLSKDKKSARVDFVSDKYIDPTAGATNVSGCLTLNSANSYYQLNASISNDTITTDCIIFSTQNITFDCDGFSIFSTQNYTGIYSNQYNTTIKNCNISMGSGGNSQAMGIELGDNADYSSVINNIITGGQANSINFAAGNNGPENSIIMNNYINHSFGGSTYGVIIRNAHNNTVFNNTIFDATGYPLYILTASYNNVSYCNITSGVRASFYINAAPNNTFTNNYGSSTSLNGFYILNSDNNVLIDNIGVSTTNTAIRISGSNNATLINNTGTCNAASGAVGGIALDSSSNGTLINNTGINNGGTIGGIAIGSSSNNNILIGNNGTAVSGYGIYIYTNSVGNVLLNNIGASTSNSGIYVYNHADYNNLTSNTGISDSGVGIALNSVSYTNLTNNLGISNSTNGIKLSGSADNNLIINNTGVSTSYFGLYLLSSDYNTLIGNNLQSLQMSTSNYNNISDNIILNVDTSGVNSANSWYNRFVNNIIASGSTYGIYFTNVSYSVVYNNTITSISGSAFQLSLGSSYNDVELNTGTSNSSVGIYLTSGANNNNLKNNLGISNSSSGIYINNANSNNLTNNTAISNSTVGLYLVTSFNNILDYNNGFSDTGTGLQLLGSEYNLIRRINASSNSGAGIILRNASYNNISDCRQIVGVTYTVRLYNNSEGASVDNILLNCSYDNSKEIVDSGNSMIRKGYYQAYIVDNNSNGVVAQVNVSNVSGDLQFSVYSDSNGWTDKTVLTDYINLGGVRNYYSPFAITVYNSSFQSGNSTLNLTGFSHITQYFTLSPSSGEIIPPSINVIYPLNGGSYGFYGPIYLSLNVTANDSSGISSMWYNIGGDNTTFMNSTFMSFSVLEGTSKSFTINVYVNDTYNNVNSTAFTIIVSQLNPPGMGGSTGGSGGPKNIIIINTTNITNVSQQTIPSVKICSLENISGVKNCVTSLLSSIISFAEENIGSYVWPSYPRGGIFLGVSLCTVVVLLGIKYISSEKRKKEKRKVEVEKTERIERFK